MLTAEENDFLTRVGPGRPAGEMLRRYWFPCAVVQDLTNEAPTRFIRLLGEDLVLFKDKGGHVGLLGDHCPHRGASLLYGRVEERGIACAYHGWLYDTQGNCLETPAEPAFRWTDSRGRDSVDSEGLAAQSQAHGSLLHLTVKHKAYPVRKLAGLYWAYLGPLPAPEIPHYDVWTRQDGRRSIVIQPQLDCNWFQAMENSVDGPHAYILHQEFLTHRAGSVNGTNTTQGFTEGIAEWRYDPVPIGIMKTRVWKDGHAESHPLIFPNLLRQANSTQIRVPLDDEHTWHIRIEFTPTEDGREVEQADEDVPVRYDEPYKQPAEALHPWTRFDMLAQVAAQDFMAWETQGPIADRTKERLGTADWGVAAFRELAKAEIAKVQQGLDPMGVTRDPDHAIIDTNLSESLRQMSRVNRGS